MTQIEISEHNYQLLLGLCRQKRKLADDNFYWGEATPDEIAEINRQIATLIYCTLTPKL